MQAWKVSLRRLHEEFRVEEGLNKRARIEWVPRQVVFSSRRRFFEGFFRWQFVIHLFFTEPGNCQWVAGYAPRTDLATRESGQQHNSSIPISKQATLWWPWDVRWQRPAESSRRILVTTALQLLPPPMIDVVVYHLDSPACWEMTVTRLQQFPGGARTIMKKIVKCWTPINMTQWRQNVYMLVISFCIWMEVSSYRNCSLPDSWKPDKYFFFLISSSSTTYVFTLAIFATR
jgi:hypothetical protein